MKFTLFSAAFLAAVVVVLASARDMEQPASSAGLVRRHHAKQARAMEEHQLEKRSFKGKATWYGVSSGDMGACGTYLDPNDYFVALNEGQYGSLNSQSSYCGKKITITNGLKTTQATILDACPKGVQCHYGALDMSRSLFSYFNDFGVGVFDITWWLGGDDNGGSSGSSGSSSSSSNNDDDDSAAKKKAAQEKAAKDKKEKEEEEKKAAAEKKKKEAKEAAEKKKEAAEKKKKEEAAKKKAEAKKEKAAKEKAAKEKITQAQNENIAAFGEIMQQLNNMVENAVSA